MKEFYLSLAFLLLSTAASNSYAIISGEDVNNQTLARARSVVALQLHYTEANGEIFFKKASNYKGKII